MFDVLGYRLYCYARLHERASRVTHTLKVVERRDLNRSWFADRSSFKDSDKLLLDLSQVSQVSVLQMVECDARTRQAGN